MRIAVVGGTGRVGRLVVEGLAAAGHDGVALSRALGVDVLSAHGLDAALVGVEAVIDTSNTEAREPDDTVAFFRTATANLLAAEARTGVTHHVLLSIVGIDRVEGNAHYAGKRAQEGLVLSGTVPSTIVRATQFHDFPQMVASWVRDGDTIALPPLLLQPIAPADVAAVLVEVATGRPRGRLEIAGPHPEDLIDLARRSLAAQGDRPRLVPTWHGGLFGIEMAGDVLLPGSGARLAQTTFDDWLSAARPVG